MKGLEALEKLPKWLDDDYLENGGEEDFKSSEEYKAVEKELKALEIIKNKKVDMAMLSYYMKHEHPNSVLKSYNDSIADKNKKLAQDEFNLLKEVMK